MKKLDSIELYKKCDLNLNDYNFKTTLDIEPLKDELLNQEKAKEILNFGLLTNSYGYNIFLSGEQSSRRKTYLKKILSDFAKKLDIPNDLCYVYNFKEERKPVLISLPPGLGEAFKTDMIQVVNTIKSEFKILFNDRKYKKEKEIIEQKYDEIAEIAFNSKCKIAKEEYKHIIEFDQEGKIYTTPLKGDNDVLSQEQFEYLPIKAKKFYKNMRNKVGILVVEMLHEQDNIQNERDAELEKLDKNNALNKIEEILLPIYNNFADKNSKIKVYLDDLKEDLIKNLDYLKLECNRKESESISTLPLNNKEDIEDITKKYSVNLIVDNKDCSTAPIVFANTPYDSIDLFGTTAIFVDSNGMMTTDFTQIRAGELLKANGGYLVIDSEYLSPTIWSDLKTILKNEKLEISSQYYKTEIVLLDALAPEPIDINLKVIILGTPDLYNFLYESDASFGELFKIHSVFELEMNRTKKNEIEYLKFISKYCKENKIKPLSKRAVERLIEYSSRVSDNQNKISLSYKNLYDILTEANLLSEKESKDIIDLEIIEKTLDYKKYMKDNFSKYNHELIANKVILTTVEGEKVGQVNGLTILNLGDFCLGEVAKITATTYIGKSKIVSVERDIDMSGPSHSKGINILTGFLNSRLSNEKPLNLTTSLTFEQNYYGIDGDSATLAEVCAILSSMSGIPINQTFAITGSMNQMGDVQAIGGVNEKIEGFFDTCKTLNSKSLNSVIIPTTNIQNLMLRKDILLEVDNGNFQIYAIDRIEEAVELLLGKSLDDIISIILSKYKNI